MPRIIEYAQVLERLTAEGLECQYYNGGVFGFASGGVVRGWIESGDETIRQEMREKVRAVPVAKMATLARRAWKDSLPGAVWVMPGSHWAFELQYGSREWLAEHLRRIGIEPAEMQGRTNAAAIEFEPAEEAAFESSVSEILGNLAASDFTMAFPGRATVCTIHHHRQLWWMSRNDGIISALDRLMESDLTHPVVPAENQRHHG